MEALENRRLLDSNLSATLQEIVRNGANDGRLLVDAIHDRVFDNVLQGTQPVIRDALRVKDQAGVDQLDMLSTKVSMAIAGLSGEIGSQSIINALNDQLASLVRPGSTITAECGGCSTSSPASEIRLTLPLRGTVVDQTTPFDLGLPRLLTVTAGQARALLTYDADLILGFSVADGVYLDTTPADDVRMTLLVTAASPTLSGQLGILRYSASNLGAAPIFQATYTVQIADSGDPGSLLTVAEIGSMQFSPTRTGTVSFNPHLVFDLGDAAFPSLGTDLQVTWPISGPLDSPLAALGQRPTVRFQNVTLDVGSFFTKFVVPISQKLDNALGPLNEIVDVLTTRIPVLSDLAPLRVLICGSCTEVTPLTFLNLPSTSGFVPAFRAVNAFIDAAGSWTNTGNAALGSFEIAGDVRTIASLALDPLTNVFEVNQSSGPFSGFLNSLSGTPIQFPILSSPRNVFQILVGGTGVEIFKLDMPALVGERTIKSPTIPILGPLGIWLEGSLKIKFDIDFGYDSQGLALWATNQFASVGDVFEGFYVVDNFGNEAELEASITAYGGVDLVLVQFGVGGGVIGRIGLDLRDPNNDGKVRPREIAQNVAIGPLCMFEFSGSLGAKLSVYAKFGISIFSVEITIDLFEVELVSYNFPCSGTDTPVPWASLDPDTRELTLNTGPRSVIPGFVYDENGVPTSGILLGQDESVNISKIGTEESTGLDILQVEVFGVKQVYTGVRSIYAEGGSGRDVIQIDPNVRARATLYGGFADAPPLGSYVDGNDVLIVGGGGGEVHGGSGYDEIGGGGGYTYTDPMGQPVLGTLVAYGDEGDDILHGSRWADVLSGGEGNDRIFGGLGDDLLAGNDGEDLLFGDEGQDLLLGQFGNDDLRGGPGDDELHGGDPDVFGFGGDDFLRGGEGDNRLYGDGGNDQIDALSGSDLIYGGEGDDEIDSGTGNDTVYGGDGDDDIFSAGGQNFLYGEAGNDRIQGGLDFDVIYGGVGNDTILGIGGGNWLFGDDGNDWVSGGDENDIIRGGNGQDILFGLGGFDTIYGDDGNDELYGGTGNDALDGGSHDDLVTGDDGDDVITGDSPLTGIEGNDRLYGGNGNDIITGNGGNDQIYGEAGNDQLVGNHGNDTIQGGTGVDIILGDNGQFVESTYQPTDGNGDDEIFGDDGNDIIYGQDGNDAIEAGAGPDTVFAGAGVDVVHGGAEDDLLYGEAGVDWLWGEAGSDVIDAGSDDDLIYGGTGSDRLYGGDGSDTIFGFAQGSGDDNTADLIYGGPGNDTLEGQGGDDFVSGDAGVDILRGGMGNDTLLAGTGVGDQLFGDDGDDQLTGSDEGSDTDPNFNDTTYFGDVLDGGNGDDTIHGLGGADNILAGGGNDWVDSGAGSDRIRGGAGNDYLYAGMGLGESIDGEDGNDTIYGSPTGNDTLTGGTGRDEIYGQGGNDSITGDADDDHLDGGTGTDVIQGGTGLDTLFGGGGVGDTLDGGAGSDVLHGSDDGADIMAGGTGRDSLFGHGGNDSLAGGADDDVLDGGAGDDTIAGDAGADLLLGGANHDVLYGHNAAGSGDDDAVDDLYGDFGTNQNEAGSGRDRLYGQGGNDRHWGEGDDDFIDAGGGTSNVVNYGAGEGAVPSDFVPPTPTPNPTVQPGVAISHAQVRLPDGVDTRGRWSEFAGSGTGDGVSRSPSSALEPSVAINSSGVRFMAWTDSRSGNYEIYVARHVPGTGWQELPSVSGRSASEGGISNTAGSSRRPSLTIDTDGNPLLAWTEFTGTGSDIRVAKYDPAASGGQGAWVALGNSLGAGGISGTGTADQPIIVATSTGPSVAWLNRNGGQTEIRAQRFNGTAWVTVGAPVVASLTDPTYTSYGSYMSYTTDGTKLAIAWTQPVAGGSQIYLREFNGTAWNALGTSASGTGISNLNGNNITPTVAYHSGSVFVAWQSNAVSRPEISAKFFNGTTWVSAGGTGVVSPASGFASQPQLSSRGGKLHLVWVDDGRGNVSSPSASIFATQWNGMTFASEVGADVQGPVTVLASAVDSLRLAVDSTGRPFIGWSAPGSTSQQVYLRGNLVQPIQVISASAYESVQFILDNLVIPNSVIHIDTNTTGFTIGPDDSGVVIVGQPGKLVAGPITIAGASDVVLQGITTSHSVTLNGGARNSVLQSQLQGGIQLNGGTDAHVIGNEIECERLLLSGSTRPVVMHNRVTVATVGVQVADATMNAVVRRNTLQTTTGIWLVNGTGLISENDIQASVTGLQNDSQFAGTISDNDIHGSVLGVRYSGAAALDGNRIYQNTTGVLARVSNPATAFGFVQLPGGGDARPNDIFGNAVGVQLELGAVMQNQRIHGNSTGVTGTGSLVPMDFDHANRIDNNGIGVDVTGTVQFNYIGDNTTGIVARSQQLIAHNFVYRSLQLGIDVSGATSTRIVSNTIYAPTVDALRIRGGASEIEFRNNLVWADSGYALHVANDSQVGFWSDYNLLHAGTSGKLVHWSGFDFADILDWQADVAEFDLHSSGRTVVNPGWSEPRFVDAAVNDFRTLELASQQRATNPSINAGDPRTDLGLTGVTPANLLENPGFASGLTGWMTNATATTGSNTPASFDTTPYFRIGTDAVGFAEQTINLLSQGFTTGQLDSSDLVAVYSGRLRSAAEAPPDRGKITIGFLNAGGGLISEHTSQATDVSDRWELVGDRVAIPVGTRQIRYRFEGARDTGPVNDAIFDHAFLRVHADTIAHDIGAVEGIDASAADSTPGPRIALRFPDLYDDWVRDQGKKIRWESFGNTSDVPVRIDLYQDGPQGPALLTNIVASTPDDGEYDWNPGISGIAFGTHGLRIQVQLVGNEIVFDRGTEPFSVPENTNTYFVNDLAVTNDQYTTAAGNNRATGRLATAPKPLPTTLLRVYSLGPTNSLSVDTGAYPVFHPLLISNTGNLGNDEGFSMSGPTIAGRTAALVYANPLLTRGPAIELNDADFVTISNLIVEGGQYGVWAHNGSDNFVATKFTISRAQLDGLRFEPTTSGSTLDFITSTANGGYGIYVSGPLNRLADSESSFNQNTGIQLVNPGAVQFQANSIHDNRGAGIFLQQFDSTAITVGSANLGLSRGNTVRDNAGHGIDARGNVLVAGNTVSGHRTVFTRGINLDVGAAQHNVVWDNYDGIVGGVLTHGNRVYKNANTGIFVSSGTAKENVVYNNAVGLDVVSTSQVGNNLVYANSQEGIRIGTGVAGTTLVNNTVYQSAGNAIRLNPQVSNLQLRNNVLWVSSGYGVDVPNTSQTGFQSDFNLIYATGNGRVGSWQGVDRPTLAAWQSATFHDQNSLAQDPQFVDADGADNLLGYANAANDGRDDDFHEQSQFGSLHGGSLAPVISVGGGVVAGLPSLPSGTLTNDPNQSVLIDRGDALDAFGNEVSPNGGFINLGAYGNTGQASYSPAQYVTVMRPDGGERWPAGQSFAIRWRSYNPAGDVTLELLDANNQMVSTIAASTPNDGEHVWSIPAGLTPSNYRLRVTRLDGGMISDVSNSQFTVPAPVSVYYVNDSTVNATGDWTTAPGNDANDGLSPETPKASLRALLDAYDLGPNDTVRVDTGTYVATTNIFVATDDSGVRIEGYHDAALPTRQAVLSRGSTVSGAYTIQFTGADDVTLDHLVVTGGQYGIVALGGADSDGISITNCEIQGNSQGGIYFDASNDAAQIVGNQVYNQSTAGVQVLSSSGATVRDNVVRDMTFGTGIEVRGGNGLTAPNLVSGNDSYNNTYNFIVFSPVGNAPVTVENNLAHGGRFFGIQASGGNALVTNNRVYQNTGSSSATGIEATLGATVQNNLVYDNVIGIHGSSSTVQNNRVFHNTNVGIIETSATIAGNIVYSQPVGIQASTGLISNNLVYASSADGIRVQFGGNGGRVVGNTVYQPAEGNALRVGGFGYTATNVTVRNNIFSVAQGYAIQVDPTSQVGFDSDYNALVTTGTGKIGNWSSRDFTSLADWTLELALDQHSQTSDPRWVDVDGADNQLGYVGTTDFGADDDFRVLTDSPTIDAGDPSYAFANEPASNGGRVNLGHTGNTSQATTSAAQFVQVLAPNGLEKLERGQVVPITWRTSGIVGGTVDLELVSGVSSGTVLSIAQGTANDGVESWTVPTSLGEGSYRIQVRANQGVQPVDSSDAPFLVVNNGQHFYVNDAATVGDVFTTAIGNNANGGRSPDQPLSSIAALLAAYDLDPGDIIHVDAGTYTLTQNITISAQDSGVRIEGPQSSTGVPPVVNLNRANTSLGSYAIQLTGADDVTLDSLSITGGEYGIVALSGADSDRLTIAHSKIHANAQKGIFVSNTNDDLLIANSDVSNNAYGGIYVEYASGATIRDNLVYNNTGGRGIELFSPASATASGNESYGHGTGIFASNSGAGPVTVSDNLVHDNRDYGIQAGTNVQVIGNTVSRTRTGFGVGSGAPLGIRVATGSVARDNVVFDNIRGIEASDGTATNNRVYHNDLVGISGYFNANLQGNTVYTNGVGIFGSNLTGRITNNLIYANANDGIWLSGSTNPRIDGNTIYQNTTGDAVQIGGTHPEFFVTEFPVSGAAFANNIFHVAQAYALNVALDSGTGLTSDYNDFSLTGAGKLGRWENTDFTSRTDWFFELELDPHSIAVDPQFIDVDGPDNVLGYDLGAGVDRGADDNFRVLAASPTIDAADPRRVFAGEPSPNGGRANLGHTGDTSQAQLSPAQMLQVLSPNGLEKYELGQTVRIDWQTAGITNVAPIALIDAGGPGAEAWSSDSYKVAGQTFSFTNPVNLGSVTNPAPAATYQVGTYGGFGVGNRVAYQLPVSDGSYTLRLHFVEPAFTGPGQRPFDIRINGVTVQSNFDIFTAAGGMLRATTLTFNTSALAGQGIALEMVNSFNGYGAFVTGLELSAANPTGVSSATVNLEYSTTNGAVWNTIASNVAMDQYGRGSYWWTSNGETAGNMGLIRVTHNTGSVAADTSDAAFLVTNSGQDFYVNDGSTTNDTFTTAAGSNLASGKRPDEPMASLAALLTAYDLDPLDVIHVDRGSYRLFRNLKLGTQDSGVRIEGPGSSTGVPPVSVLNRANIASGSYVIELAGADDVTIDRLAITGGTVGVYAPQNSQNDRLALTNNEIYGNSINLGGAFAYGVYIAQGNDDVRIAGNQVHNNVSSAGTGTGIYASANRTLIENNEAFGQTIGIEIQGNGSASQSDWATIRGNTVHDNTVAGIYAIHNAVVTGNTAFNQTGAGAAGIHVILVAASDNVAYNNTTGIISDRSTTSHNRVYRNTVGIAGRQYGTIENNQVYSNAIGISGDAAAGFYGHIISNLVYGNTNQGIYIQLSFFAGLRIVNNTIYQAVGEAIRIENASQGITLRNNVASVDAGHVIYVATNSQSGFSSNYNLFHTGDHAGFWNGMSQTSLSAWRTATGQDANSLAADPLWVDRDGPDNVLGYTIASGGYDGGSDDNFHLRRGSPAIDRADSTLSPTLDRDGFPRVDDPGTTNAGTPAGLAYVDLGAYEFQGSSNDVTPPTVVGSSIQTTSIDGGLAHLIYLTFNESLDALNALSTGHYEFRAAGLNGIFDDTDDIVFTLTPQYAVGATTLTLAVANGGASLPAGLFRLTVFGSLHDASGNPLDGDQNGSAGGDYVRINDRPVLVAIPNQTTNEGQALTWTAAAADSGSVTYSLAGGAPAGASIHPTTGQFTWTPTEAQGPGTFTISVIATDSGSPTMNDLRTFTISVLEVNSPPVINPIANQTVVRGQLLSFTVTATDPDVPTNSLAFSLAIGAPAAASIHPTTGVFRWTPPAHQPQGHYDITVLVGDNGSPALFGSRTFRVTVYPINPTLADFNSDGSLNVADIDALFAQIAAGTNPPLYDLNGDGLVNLAERDLWLAVAGAVNLPSGNPYRLGDANLDGVVDGSDFISWNQNKFASVTHWSQGNFNADGFVDGSDFIIWNQNKFTSADGLRLGIPTLDRAFASERKRVQGGRN